MFSEYNFLSKEKHNVFYHFHDASARSQTLEILRFRFVKFFSSYLGKKTKNQVCRTKQSRAQQIVHLYLGCPEVLNQYLKSNTTDSLEVISTLCDQLNSYQDEKGVPKLTILLDGIEKVA